MYLDFLTEILYLNFLVREKLRIWIKVFRVFDKCWNVLKYITEYCELKSVIFFCFPRIYNTMIKFHFLISSRNNTSVVLRLFPRISLIKARTFKRIFPIQGSVLRTLINVESLTEISEIFLLILGFSLNNNHVTVTSQPDSLHW